MTTVLVCATPEVESDLYHTLFWRDDLERYVADRTEDAGTLALAETVGTVDTVLSLPSSPAWDESLVQVLQVPTRKQARFDVRFDVLSMLRTKPGAHRGLVLNISAGGLLVECAGLPIHPGDDVTLSLPIPGLGKPVEGRARVVRTPVKEQVGLRFEAFAGDGDASVRHFLATLAAQQSSPPA